MKRGLTQTQNTKREVNSRIPRIPSSGFEPDSESRCGKHAVGQLHKHIRQRKSGQDAFLLRFCGLMPAIRTSSQAGFLVFVVLCHFSCATSSCNSLFACVEVATGIRGPGTPRPLARPRRTEASSTLASPKRCRGPALNFLSCQRPWSGQFSPNLCLQPAQ